MTTTISDPVADLPVPPAMTAGVGGPAEAFRPDGAIDPARVRLFRGPHGVLRCTIEGVKTILRAKVVRAFPLSHQARWITVLDAKNKEVCTIEDPAQLDPESQRLVEEELERQYRVSTITRISSIRNEYRTLFWEVETDRGRRDFVVKWAADTILWLGPADVMLVDIDTNRFRIPDIGRLDPRSRKLLDVLL